MDDPLNFGNLIEVALPKPFSMVGSVILNGPC